jgi:hypothetical protein
VKALQAEGILQSVPHSYTEHFERHIMPVRNNFAHGDWRHLAATLNKLDLTQSFLAVAEYFLRIKENLSRRGFEA